MSNQQQPETSEEILKHLHLKNTTSHKTLKELEQEICEGFIKDIENLPDDYKRFKDTI